MPVWIVYALLTACALATADFCVKMAAGRISNSLGLLVYGSTIFMFGIGWVVWHKWTGEMFFVDKKGLIFSVGVGVAFSLVTIGLYTTFSAGAPVSLASPLIRFGGVLLVVLAGLLFLKEDFSIRYLVGALLVVAGLYLIVVKPR